MARRKRGLCGEAHLRGRVVVVVRGERGAARKREGEMKKVVRLVPEAGTGRCCSTGNLRADLAGRGGWRGGRGDCAVRRNCAGGWWWLCVASVGPPGEREK